MGLFSNILQAASPAAMMYNKTKPVDSMSAANQHLSQIPGVAQKNLSPYIMPGEQGVDFINKIMQSYKPSEGYQFQKNELNTSLGNTAAAGGFAGTQYDQGQRGKLIQSLLSGDMQQYYDNVMNVHRGSFDASRELNDIQTGALNQQGGLAFGQAENQNSRNSALRNALLSLGGQALGGSMGLPPMPQMGGQQANQGMQIPQNAPVMGGYGGAYRRPSTSTVPGAAWGGR